MKQGFEWRGVDGAGFQYGFYRDGGKQWRVDIAIPGKGYGDPHKGKKFEVFVDGEAIGKKASLQEATSALGTYFARGHHRTEPLPHIDTPAKSLGRGR